MPRSPAQQLVAPFLSYPGIAFAGKRLLCSLLPSLLAAGAGALIIVAPEFNLTGDRGLVDATLSLLTLLVGFYVAALGLALTMQDRFLDEVPRWRPPVDRSGAVTWRRFLSALCGYLVAVSLFTYFYGVAVLTGSSLYGRAEAWLASRGAPDVLSVAKAAAGALYVFLLLHLLANTLLGLYFMSQRLQDARETAQIRSATPEEAQQHIKRHGG